MSCKPTVNEIAISRGSMVCSKYVPTKPVLLKPLDITCLDVNMLFGNFPLAILEDKTDVSLKSEDYASVHLQAFCSNFHHPLKGCMSNVTCGERT